MSRLPMLPGSRVLAAAARLSRPEKPAQRASAGWQERVNVNEQASRAEWPVGCPDRIEQSPETSAPRGGTAAMARRNRFVEIDGAGYA